MVARTEVLSVERRQAIAALIGRRSDPSPLFSLTSGALLAESFPIWIWNVDPEAGAGRLARLARATDRWHHQIDRPAALSSVARTIEGSTEHAAELCLVGPDLGAKVASAVAWADANLDDSWFARMLVVPRLMMHALWFEDGESDRLYVVDAPASTFPEASEIAAADVVELVRSLGEEWQTGLEAPPWPDRTGL